MVRRKTDSVVAPDHLSVAKPLRPEDLDRCVTWHGIYPSLPASPGVPWSAYVRSQRMGSRSVSSFTDALDSDQARHVTQRIIQHTRSLPTDSPVPYVPSTDREYKSESGLSDKYITTGVSRSSNEGYMTEHDDYATLGGITPTPSSIGVIPRTKTMSICGSPIQRDKATVERAVSTSCHPITGESATVFTDMTDTILKVLDRCMAFTAQAWELENSLAEKACAIRQPRQNITGYIQDTNPDWFLPVTGNPRISEVFYGYTDSLSLDNNPLVLVELKDFIQWYGTPIYAVDRVNGKMYHTFEGGYRMIGERAMFQPSYSFTTSLRSESITSQPLYMNTLPGTTSMGTPMAESTPVPQVGQTLFRPIVTPRVHDILEPSVNEQARADYLERRMKHMNSVQLPTSIPTSDDLPLEEDSLSRRIWDFCSRIEDHRRCEKDTNHVTLNSIKEYKIRQWQQGQRERDEVYKGMSQNLERLREVARGTLSRASTILTQECWMALTETDFINIKEKMNKIDQRIDGLYQNWQAKYKEAITTEQCEEI